MISSEKRLRFFQWSWCLVLNQTAMTGANRHGDQHQVSKKFQKTVRKIIYGDFSIKSDNEGG